jgi:TRAP-type C4-dicarboxylate transport system permease small subunit
MLGKIGKFYSEIFLFKVSRGTAYIAEAAIFVAMMVNLFMVTIRKLFPLLNIKMGGPLVGGYEITQTAMVFIATCAAAYTWYEGGHVRIGVIRDPLKERGRNILDAVVAWVGTVYFGIVCWSVALQAPAYIKMNAYTPLMRIPLGPFMIFYVVIMAHVLLVFMRSAIGLTSKALGKKFGVEPYLKGQ